MVAIGQALVLQSEWEHEDQPPPAGLGAIRKLGIWPMLGREEIIYEQDLRLSMHFSAGPRAGPATIRAR